MSNRDDEIMRALGRIEANQDNHLSYIRAVSENVKKLDEKHDAHVTNTTDAHGKKAREEGEEKVRGRVDWVVTTAIAMGTLVLGGIGAYLAVHGGHG